MVCDLLQKLELLHATGTQINPVHGQEIVQTFYDLLTVLDSKGLALLAFDGIVVAATTFAAEKGGVFHRRGLARWLAILILILSLSGAALCLWVSEISYPFFLLPNRLVVLDHRNTTVLFYVLGSLSWKNHTSYEPPKV